MAVELAILRITRLRADSRSLRNGFVLARDFVFINKLYQVLQLSMCIELPVNQRDKGECIGNCKQRMELRSRLSRRWCGVWGVMLS